MAAPTIVPFEPAQHQRAVIALWRSVFGYEAAHNEPALVIDKKAQHRDGLFFVAEAADGAVIGTVMCGYDGHRGWIYSLAVTPSLQRQGIGRALIEHAEAALARAGCVKINLQVVAGNEGVEGFYRNIGYTTEPRISMGKRIAENIPPSADGRAPQPQA